jgi:hypothetical protein
MQLAKPACESLFVVDSSRRPRYGDERGRRRGRRLGVGAASAIAKLLVATVLSGLVVVAFVEHWNLLVILVIGIAWAIAFAGLVVVPMIASFVTNALSQSGGARSVPRTTPGPSPDAAVVVAEHAASVPRLTDIGPTAAPTMGLLTRPLIENAAPGFDWARLMQRVAERLDDVLGDDFSADIEAGTVLVLRHRDEISRRANLGSSFQPPPLDVTERVMRGCLKMMDEAQMFAMQVHHDPWPSRGGTRESGPGNLARPQVRIEGGQIAMSWVDSWGAMLRLPAVPFDSASPETPDGTW